MVGVWVGLGLGRRATTLRTSRGHRRLCLREPPKGLGLGLGFWDRVRARPTFEIEIGL